MEGAAARWSSPPREGDAIRRVASGAPPSGWWRNPICFPIHTRSGGRDSHPRTRPHRPRGGCPGRPRLPGGCAKSGSRPGNADRRSPCPLLREREAIGVLAHVADTRCSPVHRQARSRCGRRSQTRPSSRSRTSGCSRSSRGAQPRDLTESLDRQTAHLRHPPGHQPGADRCAAGLRGHRGERDATFSAREPHRVPVRRRVGQHGGGARRPARSVTRSAPLLPSAARSGMIHTCRAPHDCDTQPSSTSSTSSTDPVWSGSAHRPRPPASAGWRSTVHPVPMLAGDDASSASLPCPALSPAAFSPAEIAAAPDLRRPGGDRGQERAPPH